MSDAPHDTDPEALNGDETGRAVSDRELLGRVDERSMAMMQGLEQLKGEFRGLREGSRRDLLLLGKRIEDLEAAVRESRSSADQSGEHFEQELINLRQELANEKRSALEKELQIERERRSRLEKDIADAVADGLKRRKDLAWKVVEWVVIAVIAATATHVAWH